MGELEDIGADIWYVIFISGYPCLQFAVFFFFFFRFSYIEDSVLWDVELLGKKLVGFAKVCIFGRILFRFVEFVLGL